MIVFIILTFASHFLFVSSTSAEFHNDQVVSSIAFGSCNKHDYAQPIWSQVLKEDPDLWVWLGDVVYADIRVFPFMWIPSSLESMQEKYDIQTQNDDYKQLMDSRTSILGVWDDHDYGIDGGGKDFIYRLQSQKIFLDFLNEPEDSIRRKREGLYASYSYGIENKIVKIILLDVRSHWVSGSNCDVLGEEQWKWFEEQLNDVSSQITIVGTGKQVLSDIPFIDKWKSCPSSLDKLIFLAQRQSRVFFISGDVHFSEVSCLNSTGTGYPLYEVTSSGLTHSCSASLLPAGVCDWTLKNVVASKYRVSNVVTDKSFGIIKIDWNSNPVNVRFELIGEDGILSTFPLSLDDLQVKRHPKMCPAAIEQPNWYYKRAFWCSVVLGAVLVVLLGIRITVIVGRWVALELLKDLDTKIKRRIKKLKLLLGNAYKRKNRNAKPHDE